MDEPTVDLLKRFDYISSPIKKIPNNINLSYKMADESLIDLKGYNEDRKLTSDYSDSDYTPTPIKREKPLTKKQQQQQQQKPLQAQSLGSTRLPVLPKKLFSSPTKNYSEFVAQERSGPSSPQKKSLTNEISNEDVKNLRLENKRLKQDYNAKIESLTYKLNLITKERDELTNENLVLTRDKNRLYKEKEYVLIENDGLLKESYEKESLLKEKDKKILKLEMKVGKLADLNNEVIDKNIRLNKSFEELQVKLKKYYELYQECQKEQRELGEQKPKERKDSIPKEGNKVPEKEQILQSESSALIQVLHKLTEVIEKQRDEPYNELRELITAIKESNSKQSPVVGKPTSQPIAQSTAQHQPFSQPIPDEAMPSSKLKSPSPAIATTTQPVRPSSSSYVSTNPQHIPSNNSRPVIYTDDVLSPNAGCAHLPQDLHNVNPFELHSPKERTRVPVRQRSTISSSSLDVDNLKKFIRIIVDELKDDNKETVNVNSTENDDDDDDVNQSDDKVVKKLTEPECCSNKDDSNPTEPKLCPSCLKAQDFTLSNYMGK